MKKENETARKILKKLFANCSDFAKLELRCACNRSTEEDDYFRAEGAYNAYRYICDIITEYESELD